MTVLPHKVVLSREERERIRRDAQRKHVPGDVSFSTVREETLANHCRSLLSALEQAERERDEVARIVRENRAETVQMRDELEARLAKVPALVEALRAFAEAQEYNALNVPIPATQRQRDALAALAVWEESA